MNFLINFLINFRVSLSLKFLHEVIAEYAYDAALDTAENEFKNLIEALTCIPNYIFPKESIDNIGNLSLVFNRLLLYCMQQDEEWRLFKLKTYLLDCVAQLEKIRFDGRYDGTYRLGNGLSQLHNEIKNLLRNNSQQLTLLTKLFELVQLHVLESIKKTSGYADEDYKKFLVYINRF